VGEKKEDLGEVVKEEVEEEDEEEEEEPETKFDHVSLP
jgi:hypothetical protein